MQCYVPVVIANLTCWRLWLIFFYMELGTFGKHTLLTGAGFSRNWGGYTAPEMMQQILNYLEENEEARVFWLDVTSFEEGLARARVGEVSSGALQHIEGAILKTFKSLDRQLQGTNGPWFHGVEKLLSQFYWRTPPGVEVDTGYLFTLNQDLLIERRFINADMLHARDPSLPGVKPKPSARFFSSNTPTDLEAVVATLEGDLNIIRLKKSFNYIKLHGSFNWRDETGAESMVLGDGKAKQIVELPLLSWYYEVFKSVLFSGDVRLMIIGYGFGDEHINEVICEAINDHGLRVFVWDKAGNIDWIRQKPWGSEIVSGLIGTESRDMIEVFPRSQEETESYLSLRDNFFRTTVAP
ncbi:MAG: SIR2 family protein [Candidatus Poribacteria bacterium]|nr:SIR2 family protein [Candidatus Poribacteria bacterium]